MGSVDDTKSRIPGALSNPFDARQRAASEPQSSF